MIGVVDYGAGNLRNVQAALTRLRAPWRLVALPGDTEGLTGIILPGVGQFGAAAAKLKEAGLANPLRAWIESGRPFLGICLGMQLLFEGSDEDPEATGLAMLQGWVRRVEADRLPHIGWAVVEPLADAGSMFAELSDGGFFAYFAHSFALHQPAPSAVALTSCPASFVSAVRSGNIWGVQFHPEKSGADGHRLLASFVALADESKSGGGAA